MEMNEHEKRCAQLRALVTGPGISRVMESHNGLSAKIVQSCGFPAIWASGLSISTMLGVRDSNELTSTQCLDILEYMSDATDLPILFDGDTGHGNFNNARILTRKLCQRSIAGVVIEDKIFPKMNSFVGERQPLAAIDEFSGKIKAMKDTQTAEDFQVIARVEALIAGHSIEEALERAHAYCDAGADAIFIHSKKQNPEEILDFAIRFEKRAPLVVAPTTYSSTSLKTLEKEGVTICICANQNMRASFTAMTDVCRRLSDTNHLDIVENQIASLPEVFQLIDYKELETATSRYLP